MYTEALELKVKRLNRTELESLAVQALYHLRVVSGSRNSYSSDWMEEARIAGVGFPKRDQVVENMHHRAAEFIEREDA